MGTFLDPGDLPSDTGSNVGLSPDQMIEDAEALALLAAPCLGDDPLVKLTDAQQAAVKAILRGSIMRWSDVGTGSRSSVTTGPFGEQIDTSTARRGMFWPTEITQLQDICGGGSIYTTSLAGADPDPGPFYDVGWHY